MSHMSDVQWVGRNDDTENTDLGTIAVPTDAKIVEIYIYPNGGGNSADAPLLMRFNGDAGTNYGYMSRQYIGTTGYTYSVNMSGQTHISPYEFVDTDEIDQSVCKIVIYPRRTGSNSYRSGRVEFYSAIDSLNNQYLQDSFFAWLNTADSITSIEFSTAVSTNHFSNDMMVKFIR